MKTSKILSLIALITGVLVVNAAQAQCNKKKFCDKEAYGDFDFRSQSSYAVLSPGDTARASIVVYSAQDARILVCSDPYLGSIRYRIYEPKRVTKRTVKDIRVETLETPIYKLDKYGNPIQEVDEWGEPAYDENWDPIYKIEGTKRETIRDTIWQTERIVTEEIIYDNQKDGTAAPFWQQLNVPETKRLIIEVIVPDSENQIEGCVNVEVGHRYHNKNKTFYRLD